MNEKFNNSRISLPAAVSIGIGGMIGAGIFSILGVVSEASGTAMWISFLIGGVIALFSTYSYAKLGAKFPTAGGAVEFLVRGWGKGLMSGGINLFMWIGYVIAIALYAQGFSAYCATFFTQNPSPLLLKSLASGIVILFTGVNVLGAGSVGRAEVFIVGVKVSILILFAVSGLFFIKPENLSPALWNDIPDIFFGAGVLFIGYEGFGLVTNAAGNMNNPQKMLPKALYISVFIVILIYLAVSITVTGNLSISQIYSSRDFALAEAAKPFLGNTGFKLIAIAALFSTASAINATLFGGANVSYMIARDGQLPEFFSRKEWKGATGGLLVTAFLVIVFILFFNLSGIAMMGSGAFLLIYAAVNAGHLKIIEQTGAKKSIVIVSIILCLIMFAILEIYTFKNSAEAVWTMLVLLLLSFAGEKIFEKYRVKQGN
ncbi:MAG: Inner membrane transport protein YbaT [Ignavibacteria bacterium]|nr:Inner membrane transport protein YbaT [Ignavibacteria bacterium]